MDGNLLSSGKILTKDGKLKTVSVKAGKRTYFFDEKETKNNDRFITITESRKITDEKGNVVYDKHKIFLYKEDFENFVSGLLSIINSVSFQPVGEQTNPLVADENVGDAKAETE